MTDIDTYIDYDNTFFELGSFEMFSFAYGRDKDFGLFQMRFNVHSIRMTECYSGLLFIQQ